MEEIEKKNNRKMKKEFYFHLVLIFIAGLLCGIALKTEALKKITIGYSDYLVINKPQNYNINQAQADLSKAQEAAMQSQTNNNGQNQTQN